MHIPILFRALLFAATIVGLVLAPACENLSLPDPFGPPEEERDGASPSMTLTQRHAALPATGPFMQITSPQYNEIIDIDDAGPVDIAFEFQYLPHPGDTTGGLQYVLNGDDPVALSEPVSGPSATTTLTLPRGAHVITLIVTDDEGVPYDDVAARDSLPLKISIPCSHHGLCEDGNPCSAGFCVIVGDEQRCRYGGSTTHPHCCQSDFECRPHEMCVDIFPLGRPDGVKECVGCDGTDSNCEPIPCMDAFCHEHSFTCFYEPTEEDCCVPGVDTCPLDPCVRCLPEDGFEGTCQPVDPAEECCLVTEAPPGYPDFGCFTDEPCATYTCRDNTCYYDVRYRGCCVEDTDCNDPLRLNPCTGDYGECRDLQEPPEGGPATGVCAYPRVVPDCCVTSTDCLDRFPAEIGTCILAEGSRGGHCEYYPNENYCETAGPAIVINEIMIQSGVGAPGNWIELFNLSEYERDLRGFTIVDLGNVARSFTLEAESPLTIPPTGFFVIGASSEPHLQGGASFDYSAPELDLQPNEDGIRLEDPDGVAYDTVEWDSSFPIEFAHSLARTAPNRPGESSEAWRKSTIRYGSGGRGTPGRTNIDAYDAAWVSPLCDDGDPCTLDLCHVNRANICANIRIPGCCTHEDDPVCNDHDHCTIDSCDLETNRCRHTFDLGRCCRNDGDCPPAPPGMSLPDESAFSVCLEARCISRQCVYVRRPERPGCCTSADDVQLGCRDYNPCTVGVCDPHAGLDNLGVHYPACVYPLDQTGDGLNDCCYTDEDCDDLDPTTKHRCLTDETGPLAFTCERTPDPNYCGPRAESRDCDDGDPCTDGYCCQDEDDPLPGCPGPFRCLQIRRPDCCASDSACDDGNPCTTNHCCTDVGDPVEECDDVGQCVNIELPNCCTSAAECEALKPDDLACLTSRCFNGRCIYTDPPIYEGCCLTDSDCGGHSDRCRVFACVEGHCLEQDPLVPPHCCYEDSQCPRPLDPCKPWVCYKQECVQVVLENCCRPEDEGLTGPCSDGNHCTEGLCRGGRCLQTWVGGFMCCQEDNDCPPTGARCATGTCLIDEGRCEISILSPDDPACAGALPFFESFSMHSFYGFNADLDMLGWQVARLDNGAPEILPRAQRLFETFVPDPLLDQGRTARYRNPQGKSEEQCLISPPIDTLGVSAGTLQWREASQNGDKLERRILIGTDTSWWLGPDIRDEAELIYDKRYSTPVADLDDARVRVAFCVRPQPGAQNIDDARWSIDDIVLAAGEPPVFSVLPSAQVVAYAGNTRWFDIELEHDGIAPRGFGRISGLAVQLVRAPRFLELSHEPLRSDGRQRVWGGMFTSHHHEGRYSGVVLRASDGALRSYAELDLEVRSALCGVDDDCKDGDPCTVGICTDDQLCRVTQPMGCFPVTLSN